MVKSRSAREFFLARRRFSRVCVCVCVAVIKGRDESSEVGSGFKILLV